VAIPAELFVSSPPARDTPNAAPPAELAHLLVRVAGAEAEVQGLVGREQQLQVRLLAARDVKLEQALKDTVEATAKARRQLQTYEDAVAEQTFLLGAEDVRSCGVALESELCKAEAPEVVGPAARRRYQRILALSKRQG
jgi:hypothetical protein